MEHDPGTVDGLTGRKLSPGVYHTTWGTGALKQLQGTDVDEALPPKGRDQTRRGEIAAAFSVRADYSDP